MRTIGIMLALVFAFGPAQAADDDAEIRAALAGKLPGVDVEDVSATPVAGLYEVRLGPRVAYVSADGRYLIDGRIIDLETRANITDARASAAREAWVNGLDESKMIVFEPAGGARHTVTVFTDVDCGYCRAMHSDIDGLLKRGVRVRYILYPRNGLASVAADKMENVWCSADRRDALTRAKRGETVTAPKCETPVAENLALGQSLPVRGTPTLVTERGELIPGYLETTELVKTLDELKSQAQTTTSP